MAEDALLAHSAHLQAKVDAWTESWRLRGETAGAMVAVVLSQPYLGAPLSSGIETRLHEARQEISGQLARLAGALAAGIALLCRAGDTDALERATVVAFSKVGRHEDGFGAQMAELAPLLETYRRLSLALRRD